MASARTILSRPSRAKRLLCAGMVAFVLAAIMATWGLANDRMEASLIAAGAVAAGLLACAAIAAPQTWIADGAVAQGWAIGPWTLATRRAELTGKERALVRKSAATRPARFVWRVGLECADGAVMWTGVADRADDARALERALAAALRAHAG